MLKEGSWSLFPKSGGLNEERAWKRRQLIRLCEGCERDKKKVKLRDEVVRGLNLGINYSEGTTWIIWHR